MKHLILGGARSGKSRFAQTSAENLVRQSSAQGAGKGGKSLYYIATAQAGDAEMVRRIARHRNQRGTRWRLCEEPLALAGTLRRLDSPNHCLLVDCLTLWLSNCLQEGRWDQRRSALLETVDSLSADLLLVSNEVGSGIVPLGELSRRFADEAGWLHQELARRCQRVTLVCAGLPLSLKDDTLP
ncbi:MAG: bifunctional adenosylcobinamide kinase/adenosylcobinamide-phosphate guanylyltransferase [Parahaliea sp.]